MLLKIRFILSLIINLFIPIEIMEDENDLKDMGIIL